MKDCSINRGLTLVGFAALSTMVAGYQFDAAKDPNYPVLLPAPWNISFT
jgi:hypothetical protein